MRFVKSFISVFLIFIAVVATSLITPDLVEAADPAPRIVTKHVYQERNGKKCSVSNGCTEAGQDLTIALDGISYNDGTPFPDGGNVKVRMIGLDDCWANGWPDLFIGSSTDENDNWWLNVGKYAPVPVSNGKMQINIPGAQIKSTCRYKIEVHLPNDYHPNNNLIGAGVPNNTGTIATSLPIAVACREEQCNEDLDNNASYELCRQINTNTPQYQACIGCFSGDGIWTAVGCIPSNPQSVVKVVVTIGLGLGGGVVLIMILVGAATLSVSQGDPNKTKEAQEMITSAVIGLVFVIFSVTILQFIGVSVLHIPGFGG